MSTKDNPTEKSILVKIADKLYQAQQELDELAVQLSLGKAEAKDKYQEIKKEFSVRINELKQIISAGPRGKAENDIVLTIIELDTLLNAEKVETSAAFETQKNKILHYIEKIETKIKDKVLGSPAIHDFKNEFEKFKLKLEILRLKFVLKKFKVNDDFRAGMKTARKAIREISEGTENQIKKGKEKIGDLSEEISKAFKHLSAALKHL